MPRIPEHRNWIGGEWCASSTGITFELRDARGVEGLGRFARSSIDDLASAAEACARALPAWRELGPEERARRVARVRTELELDAGASQWIERRLGLERAELAIAEATVRASTADLVRDGEPRAEPGVVLAAPDWSELLARPFDRMCAVLARGDALVLLSDPALAGAWHAVAEVIERADLPRGLVALLHEDAHTCVAAAVTDPRFARVELSGAPGRVRALRDTAVRGAGAGRPAFEGVLLRNRSQCVGDDDDLEARARDVAADAFGRARSLSGQAPGQVGRVLCSERHFSRFSASLLDELEGAGAAPAPLPVVQAATKLHVARAHQLGIDEGATLILGGQAARARAVETMLAGPLESEPASPPARSDGILRPIVFTNVEEHMRLAWIARPAPVLCLLRMPSAAAARALAAELDADSTAEDLSA